MPTVKSSKYTYVNAQRYVREYYAGPAPGGLRIAKPGRCPHRQFGHATGDPMQLPTRWARQAGQLQPHEATLHQSQILDLNVQF